MKKLISIVVCFFSMAFCAASPSSTQEKKIKIVVLTSKGGNGHMSACATLKDIFPFYNITLANPIYDIFHKTFDGEDTYVKFVQNGWVKTANFIVRYPGQMYFKMNRNSFRKRIFKYLEKEIGRAHV